jgi:hypothetical protein
VTVCGIILAGVPLALWIAWTPFGFLMVLTAGALSLVLLGVLLARLPPSVEDSDGRHDDQRRTRLSDEFVEEIHKIFPLTYHHSRIEPARFRRTMDKLRRLIR